MKKLYTAMVIVAIIFVIFNLMSCTEKAITMPDQPKKGIHPPVTPDRVNNDQNTNVKSNFNL